MEEEQYTQGQGCTVAEKTIQLKSQNNNHAPPEKEKYKLPTIEDLVSQNELENI
jgi:hypothetical protein